MSRDEVAAALVEVTAGRIPRDRLALKELVQEVRAWPFLDAEEELQAEQEADSNYEGITDTGEPAVQYFSVQSRSHWGASTSTRGNFSPSTDMSLGTL